MTISFVAGVKWKGKIYFSSVESNGIFCFDPDIQETRFISVIPEEPIRYFSHIRAFLHNNEMWTVPLEADGITCFNMESNKVITYEIPDRAIVGNKYVFFDGVREADDLFLIPYHADHIMKIDMDRHICSKWYQAEYFKDFIVRGGFIWNGVLSLIKADGRVGLKLDVESGDVLYEDSELNGGSILYASRFHDEIWEMSDAGVERYKLDDRGNLDHVGSIETRGNVYYHGMEHGEEVILFPCDRSRTVLRYNMISGELEYFDDLLAGYEKSEIWFQLISLDSDDGCWAASINGAILDFSNSDDIRRYKADADIEVLKCLHKEYDKQGLVDGLFGDKVIREGFAFYSLNDYLSYIMRR